MRKLWDSFAAYWLWYVENVPREKWRTKHLTVLRQFLRDAGVTAQAGREAADAGKLGLMVGLMIPFGDKQGRGH
jgi:hypothetical protein